MSDLELLVRELWHEESVGSPNHKLSRITSEQRIVCTCGQTVHPEKWRAHRGEPKR